MTSLVPYGNLPVMRATHPEARSIYTCRNVPRSGMSAWMIISYSSQYPTGLTTCGVPSEANAATPDNAAMPAPSQTAKRRRISAAHDDGGMHLAVESLADSVI